MPVQVLKTKSKMPIAASFSSSYAEARAKFRTAAREAGGAISSFHNPAAAPAGAICESSGIAPIDAMTKRSRRTRHGSARARRRA